MSNKTNNTSAQTSGRPMTDTERDALKGALRDTGWTPDASPTDLTKVTVTDR